MEERGKLEARSKTGACFDGLICGYGDKRRADSRCNDQAKLGELGNKSGTPT